MLRVLHQLDLGVLFANNFILHVLQIILWILHGYEIHTPTPNPTVLTKPGPLTC